MTQFKSKQDVCDWFNRFEHPHLAPNWAERSQLLAVNDKGVVTLTFPFAIHNIKQSLSAWIEQQVESQQLGRFEYEIKVKPKTLESHTGNQVKGVKNIIAVTSAKGGVGKSTTSVNLALAIAQSGAKVGILDADVYGPSVPLMLGTQDARPEVRDNRWMQPIQAHGIFAHSIGYLVAQDEAAVWRGPMASKALAQLLNETEWPELDYLIVDMPPGTGDIQLTLSQQIPVTGSVIVTTPQDLALADAIKGVAMFEKVSVPVVGVVENMSYHICSQCGSKEHIFGAGGAEAMAREFGLSLLGQIPLHIHLREDIDNGAPTVVSRPESEHSERYLDLAERVCSQLYWQGKVKPDSIMFTEVK
ncbi:iron-sulfur cluster carrier protein ApbC [Vibrio maerlii]|uniref:iron-sulfur cluster carrier protein ApbC n=1 Tax=Vibrio maerlii TaxID=2231648 RepID=UPI000E3EB7D9|nr:iron-sulfur cluster carrier protein ApbC [Vibrio maerlii]